MLKGILTTITRPMIIQSKLHHQSQIGVHGAVLSKEVGTGRFNS